MFIENVENFFPKTLYTIRNSSLCKKYNAYASLFVFKMQNSAKLGTYFDLNYFFLLLLTIDSCNYEAFPSREALGLYFLCLQ